MRLHLERIVERVEHRRFAAGLMGDRLCKQPVAEPRVAGQQRPVEVRTDRPARAATLVAALAVVPEARDDPAERLRALVQECSPGVVLEPGERARLARERALE